MCSRADMAKMFTTVKHTFVHVEVEDPDGSDMGRISRPRASSAPARVKFDARSLHLNACAAEKKKLSARAVGEQSLEDLSLSPQDEAEPVPMHAHSPPWPIDMDAENVIGGDVSKTDLVDHLWGRSGAQRKDEIRTDFVTAGMAGRITVSGVAEAFSASALVNNGFTYGGHVLNEKARESQVRNLPCFSTAPTSAFEPARHQCFSTFPTPPRQEQTNYGSHSCSGYAPAAVPGNPYLDEAHVAENRTTVMLMNVPCGYSSSKLISTIDSQGFAGMYDFIYVPMDFGTRTSMRYAFVNLLHPFIAQRFLAAFDGFSRWSSGSKSVCNALWAKKHQGLRANIDRYRNSTVMAESVPHEYKPRLFKNGLEIGFPPRIETPPMPKPTERAGRPRQTKRHAFSFSL
eukprot:TRINITY_DN4931_c5_g1_i1.p1 TRINITY_DN4931_c5_g1~~TRINITY_DN4931_c5_g1_i1.p1  ORF type:complete len:401 (+),score=43.52 TRINITY_DN4931_c5_g1_i1:18-1220(+)